MIENLKLWTIKAVIVAVLYVIATDIIDRLKYNRCLYESYGVIVESSEWNDEDYSGAKDVHRLKALCIQPSR